MKRTATEKAIGELNMRKSDIERAKLFLEKGDDLDEQLGDIERCIALLRDMAIEPSAKPKRTRKRKLAGAEA